jgi:hypothetical protein
MGNEENYKILSHDTRPLGGVLHSGLPEYEAGVLIARPPCSIYGKKRNIQADHFRHIQDGSNPITM